VCVLTVSGVGVGSWKIENGRENDEGLIQM
jgi:hypothetical protein